MARSYIKHDTAYWEARRGSPPAPQPITVNNITAAGPSIQPTPFPDVEYGTTSTASAPSSGGAPATTTRFSQNNNGVDLNAFQNIRAMASPFVGYNENRTYVGMKDAIFLSAKAWAGIPIVRNAVEVAVEFSSQPLVIKCSNVTVKTFFQEWFKAVQMNKLVRQSMREYYRSGNPFFYTFYGEFGPAYYKNFQNAFGTKENKVPIRYELLNPTNVFVPNGLTFPYTYVRLLSTYEVERLKNPITPQDKQVFKDLPQIVKDQIKVGSIFPLGLYIPMEPGRLRFFFYKKQDYEPLAIPMIWPVLPDLEWKLTLKKMDMELARKIEQAILLITTGESPSQYNGGNGINQNNIARLQNLFTNQTISRVLVADYTTKAQWLIPDIKEILGPEKYQIVNEDIQEGLQSIFGGGDKFANAMIKAKIFIQRLEEGQNCFLDDFLLPEVQSICDKMGFRTVPEIKFRKIDLQDEAVMARIYAQLAQIGVLTAEQAINAIETQVLPDGEELTEGQTEYKKARDKGLYEPLVGGQKDDGTGPNGRPAGSGGGKQVGTRKSSPIGTSRAAFSMKTYLEHLRASQDLSDVIHRTLKKRFKIKSLNAAQQTVAHALVQTIISIEPRDRWTKVIATVMDTPPQIPVAIAKELDEIALTYEVDAFDAAILRHCQTVPPEIR